MKKVVIFIFLFGACVYKDSHKSHFAISIINDVTDSMLLRPNATAVVSFLDIANRRNDAFSFRYREISDKVFSTVVDMELKDEVGTALQNKGSIPMYRERLVKRFADSVKITLSKEVQATATSILPYSECFKVIIEELIELSKSKAKDKVLLVFSDLAEHSPDIFTCFSPDYTVLPATLTKDAIKAFENTNLIYKRYDGITVFIVYKPRTRYEDKRFALMSQAYKSILEKRGARVTIQAQNNSFKL